MPRIGIEGIEERPAGRVLLLRINREMLVAASISPVTGSERLIPPTLLGITAPQRRSPDRLTFCR
jgi:hypothetical protein